MNILYGVMDMAILKKRIQLTQDSMWMGWPYLTVLLLSFLLGALGGFFLAISGDFSNELRGYLMDYFQFTAQGSVEVSFVSVVWDCIRWPLAVLAFSFTALGAVAIPLLIFTRGFLLSYAAASICAILGRDGSVAALVLFWSTVLLVLPALFVISCECLRSACSRLPGAAASAGKWCRPEVLLPTVGVLAIAVALQWTLTPGILSAVCIRLFT